MRSKDLGKEEGGWTYECGHKNLWTYNGVYQEAFMAEKAPGSKVDKMVHLVDVSQTLLVLVHWAHECSGHVFQ